MLHNMVMCDSHVCVCGDVGGNIPTALPIMQKYSTYNCVQYIICDNDNDCYLFILYYTFYHYFTHKNSLPCYAGSSNTHLMLLNVLIVFFSLVLDLARCCFQQ